MALGRALRNPRFAKALKALRARRSITQWSLAREVGLSPSGILRLENESRRPSRETVELLSRFFGPRESVSLWLESGYVPEDPETRALVGAILVSESILRDAELI